MSRFHGVAATFPHTTVPKINTKKAKALYTMSAFKEITEKKQQMA